MRLGLVLKLPVSRWISRGQLALVYDKQRRLPRVLLLSPLNCLLSEPLLKELKTNSAYCSHPLLVPLALVKVVLEASVTRLYETENDLNVITSSTGQHRWANAPAGNPREIDFKTTTRDLNSIGRNIAAETAILTSMTHTLRIMREFAKTIEQLNAGELMNPEKHSNNDTAAAVMEEKMQYFAEIYRSLLGQAEYLQKVNGTMIQVVT